MVIALALVAGVIAITPSANASCGTHACWQRVHQHRRAAWAHHHPWLHARSHLPPWGIAMLARLRGCETRGIPYPANYRYTGAHDGAYQFLPSTYARTVAYLPSPLRRYAHGGRANESSPAEQDVRTFHFFPSHRGEWQCRA